MCTYCRVASSMSSGFSGYRLVSFMCMCAYAICILWSLIVHCRKITLLLLSIYWLWQTWSRWYLHTWVPFYVSLMVNLCGAQLHAQSTCREMIEITKFDVLWDKFRTTQWLMLHISWCRIDDIFSEEFLIRGLNFGKEKNKICTHFVPLFTNCYSNTESLIYNESYWNWTILIDINCLFYGYVMHRKIYVKVRACVLVCPWLTSLATDMELSLIDMLVPLYSLSAQLIKTQQRNWWSQLCLWVAVIICSRVKSSCRRVRERHRGHSRDLSKQYRMSL